MRTIYDKNISEFCHSKITLNRSIHEFKINTKLTLNSWEIVVIMLEWENLQQLSFSSRLRTLHSHHRSLMVASVMYAKRVL